MHKGSNSLCHEDVDAKCFFWVCISPPFKVTMTWHALLRGGLCNFSDFVGTTVIRGVRVERLRPHCPALFLSGATPGQFYHSHPHVPSEFDHLDFSMEAQVRSNITTIHKIGRAVLDYSQVVPFNFGMDWLRSPYLLHWISGNGNGFASNLSVVEAAGPAIATELGMDKSHILGLVEVGDNVSDRRFYWRPLECFHWLEVMRWVKEVIWGSTSKRSLIHNISCRMCQDCEVFTKEASFNHPWYISSFLVQTTSKCYYILC